MSSLTKSEIMVREDLMRNVGSLVQALSFSRYRTLAKIQLMPRIELDQCDLLDAAFL